MKTIEYLKENNIDIDKSIEILGDMETYHDILKDFIEQSKERISKIAEYKKNNDLENYAIEVHALKGDSNYLGFTKLAELSLAHQLKAQENDLEYINSNYENLIKEYHSILKIMTSYLKD